MNDFCLVGGDTHFGFVPNDVYEALDSQEFTERVNASQQLLKIAKNTLVESVDFKNFLFFTRTYLQDENFGVVNSFSEIIESFLPKIDQDLTNYSNEFVEMALPALGDSRRAVRMLISNLIVSFSTITQSYTILQNLMNKFEEQPLITQASILDTMAQFVTVIPPPHSIFQEISDILDTAFGIVNVMLHTSAKKLAKKMVDIDPDFIDLIQADARSFIKPDDEFKPPIRAINSARPAVTYISTLPPLQKINRALNTPTIKKVTRADENWYHTKPKLAKTAEMLIAQKGFLTPQIKAATPIINFHPSSQENLFSNKSDPEDVVTDYNFDTRLPTKVTIEDSFERFDTLPQIEKPAVSIEEDPIIPYPEPIQQPIQQLPPEATTPKTRHTVVSFPQFPIDETVRTGSPPSQRHPPMPKKRPPPLQVSLNDINISLDEEESPPIKPRPPPSDLQIKGHPINKAPRKKSEITPKPQTAPKSHPKPKEPDVTELILGIQAADWEKQNESAASINKLITTHPKLISTNLRTILFDLIPLASSIRSTLSKTALTCLNDIAINFGPEITPMFENLVNDLLIILLSSKSFINRLAGDCISNILNNVNRKKALEYLASDHKKRPGNCKIQLSICLEDLCLDCDDPTQIIKTIGSFITDANSEVRKHAKGALLKLGQKFPNISSTSECMSLLDESEKKAISNALAQK